ncbi:glutathione peroxidase [Liquorilactobacillus sicerae]|uniref:glutathione peroxidase n=1 Tax=Liquorilactobacillus sicerae TaxID=1416943 RepID=UPI002480B695|nr:glutathione peroxidase [Liquorilactobacillus sicerae]
MNEEFYNFEFTLINGESKKLADYRGKVIIIVNTASKCGHTPQLADLESLYQEFGPDRFKIIGFPCNQFLRQDPGTNEEIESFCRKNFGVTFDISQKVKVRGKEAIPLFKYLIARTNNRPIKWNFTKFLIDQEGQLVRRLEPKETPLQLATDIGNLIQ